ncbi:major facilitator superfamily domain-containing protein [Halteromyces radiatus]|uniref:major facilitator superfamily domain-containing protein n=1 Tax=Halteromyces radiatus TaxID=101107 RepID=UPI00221EC9FB|nr:major facilitator superfamily domain-containing protein [Halteromyces radiatus]KAI8099172.1 major facilitator superfamily domain-containing protein [Halteromyces radiatus]
MDSIESSSVDHTNGKMHWKKQLPPLLQGFYFQLLAGINDANLGIILPSIKAQYGLTQYVVSIVFLCTTAGYMLAAVMNGYLIRKYNQVGTAMIGSVSLVAGYLVFSCPIPFPVLCVFMIFIGFGLALVQSCSNVISSQMPRSTVILNFLHAFYGFGALLGPLIASGLPGWQDTYRLFCGLSGFSIVLQLFTFHDYDPPVEQQESSTTDKDHQRIMYDTLHQPILYACAVFLLLYVGTEVCIGNWGYTFLITARSNDTTAMAHIMTGYWGGICAGRLGLSWLTFKIGEKKMIYSYVSVLIGMLFLLWFVPLVSVNATALVIIGITIGPLFPTTVALTTKVVPDHLRATTIGFLCAFGSGGSALFPYAGGVLIGSLGVRSLLPFCISMAIMMLISWIFVPNPDSTHTFYCWIKNRLGKKTSNQPTTDSISLTIIT